MPANLLLHIECFAWRDLTLNRAREMDDLILAVDQADEWEDIIYGHPNAYNPHLGWGTINDLLSYSEEEYRLFTGGWFTNDHQKILLKLWRNPTMGNARDLIEMEKEPVFEGANNGLIGCFFLPLPLKMVYDEASLAKLHQDFVWQNQHLRKASPVYFYQHYRPALRVAVEQIREWIRRQPNSWFDRLDTPVTDTVGQFQHGGKIEIHFKDTGKSCLYLDGTWKHGSFAIPKEAKEKLEEWGFVLPLDQR